MMIFTVCYAAAFLAAANDYHAVSGGILILAAAYLYMRDYRKTGNLIHLRGLFSFFWISGQGVACFQLSNLQKDWSILTWLCFYLAWLGFYAVYEILDRRTGREPVGRLTGYRSRGKADSLFVSLMGVTAVSLGAFCFEAWYLGYVPFLVRGVPHAYSYFHVTGVHYLTVSCVLVPALGVLFFLTDRKRSGKWKQVMALVAVVISLLIPILCVSRFQLILAVLLAVLTYILCEEHFPVSYGVGVGVFLVVLYVILTIARSHDVAYLNGIFEMKNEHMPIFVTQPYMYIANNYENFNYMVENLGEFAWGMRSLFPLWALTGLKFFMPSLANYPILVNKEELTTVTLFYDAYYDFGIVGVLAFSCILGAVCFWLMKKAEKMRNPVGYLFYAQMAVYLMLSFFTTWFSNPATWFYFAVTAVIDWYCSRKKIVI